MTPVTYLSYAHISSSESKKFVLDNLRATLWECMTKDTKTGSQSVKTPRCTYLATCIHSHICTSMPSYNHTSHAYSVFKAFSQLNVS